MAKSSTSWQAGQTGNAGGRPKAIAEVRECALQYSVEAIEKLRDIMRDDKNPRPAQVAACREIIDRAVGRALESRFSATEKLTRRSR